MKDKVIIIGGGIIGCSTAYYLAKEGKQVVLIEKKDICAETSSSCDQAILLQTKQPGPLLEYANESAYIYKNLETELNKDIEYKNEGGMIVFENEEHKTVMTDLVNRQREFGLDVGLISSEEAQKKQPGISKHILGSTWSKQDAKVNSYKLTFAFAQAAVEYGAKIITDESVKEIIEKNKKVKGVITNKDTYYADKVVVAAGVWSSELLKKFNINLPIKPRKGHILVTEKLPPIMKSNFLSASYILAKGGNNNSNTREQELGVGLVMGQTKSGNVLIGGSREFKGYDTQISTEIIQLISQEALKVLPFFKNIDIIRTFTGFRPYTPDKLPIMGEINELKGLYINSGHEGDGIALAPFSGKYLAKTILNQPISLDLSPLSANRFTNVSV